MNTRNLPPPAARLLEVVEIRTAARALGIERVEAVGSRVLLTFSPATPVSPERLLRAIHAEPGRLRVKKEFVVEATLPEGPWPVVRRALETLLETFR